MGKALGEGKAAQWAALPQAICVPLTSLETLGSLIGASISVFHGKPLLLNILNVIFN